MDSNTPKRPKKYQDPKDTYLDAVKANAEKVTEVEKPHYYGKVDGIHVFHATHATHSSMIGRHLNNASDSELQGAIADSKNFGTHAIVLHGAPPESFRSRIHPKLGVHKPGKIEKSEVGNVPLYKAFLQPDQATRTDAVSHATSLATGHPALMKWGQEKLQGLPKDAIESLELDGKTIKVRKYDADLYTGQVLNQSGDKIHAFERLTLPELMTQLQSKLELYGREEEAVEDNKQPAQGQGLEQIQARLEKLRGKIRGYLDEAGLSHAIEPKADPERVEVPAQEASTDGDTACEDCGSTRNFCDCYQGLPEPRIEIDLKSKKINVFFKSEWAQEERETYLQDVRKRLFKIALRKMTAL